MPTTTPAKLVFRYPVSKTIAEKPDDCAYTEEGFVRCFRLLAGSGKPFGVSTEVLNGRTKNVIGTKITLAESGKFSAVDAVNYIAMNAPTALPLITKFEPLPIKCALTLENLYDAWSDVTRHIHFLNRGDFNRVSDVESMIVSHYRLAFNQETEKLAFGGPLFSKIVDRVDPEIAKLPMARSGPKKGAILARLQNGDSDLKDLLTTSTDKKEALIKSTQWADIVKQASAHFISYTPPTDEDNEATYRFVAITDGKANPGRNGKIVGQSKTEYIEYMRLGPGVYDRTRSSSNLPIADAPKPSAPSLKLSDGSSILTTKKAERAPLSEDEMKLVALARKKFEHSKMVKLPTTDHGIYAWALKAQNDGILEM